MLYFNGILFGGSYDDEFLIETINSNAKYSLKKEVPYENAKPMFMVEDLENKKYIESLIKETCDY